MKNRKRIISLLCAVVMIFTMAVPAGAAEIVPEGTQDIPDGYTAEAEYDGIYTDDQNEYIYADVDDEGNTILCPMEKIVVGPAMAVSESDSYLPPEVLNALQEALASAQVDTVITLFAPKDDDSISTASTSSEWTSGTYNGVGMKNYLIYTTNGSTGYKTIESDAAAVKAANLIITLMLSATGTASSAVSLMSSGISLLQAFKDAFNLSTVVGSNGDYLQVNLTYDGVNKLTYMEDGSILRFGLSTKKVTIKTIYTCQYYADSKQEPYTTVRSTSVTTSSANYASPYAVAYNCAISRTQKVETAAYTIYGQTFEFT